MKHLKTYSLFESNQNLTPDQETFLKKHTIGVWSLNPTTGLVDIEGDFDCEGKRLKDFKGIRFGKISGHFYCSNNFLTTLEGAPQTVGGDFYCGNNSLTTLEGAPQTVGGDFYCSNNSLTTLEGAPESVGGDFDCDSNSLTTLEGAPQSVGGTFYCDAFSTEDWTLGGKLQILETGSEAAKTLMATLVSPAALQKMIDQDPSKAAVALKGIWKTLKTNPKFSSLQFPEGLSKKADLLADLDGIGL